MHVNIIPRDRIEQTATADLRRAYERVVRDLEHYAARNPHSEDARLTYEEAVRYYDALESRGDTI